MKNIVPLSSFERHFKKLPEVNKKKVIITLELFEKFLLTGDLPAGLGFKKVNHNKYELRVDIHLRILIKNMNDCYALILVSNHDDIRKYLKQFRQH